MLTSYALIRLVDTDVEVRKGVATVAELLSIAPRCSVAILVREPSKPLFRIRFCGMTLTDDGLVPEPSRASECGRLDARSYDRATDNCEATWCPISTIK